VRVLVTGGAGFIGSNLVDVLVRDFEVGVVDDLSTGKAEHVNPKVWFKEMDILDDGFARALGEFGPDAVVHLAAQPSVAASLLDPDRDWEVNAEGTRRVAEAARDAGAVRVYSASSAAVYGEPVELPLPESAQKDPLSPYGRSKLASEELLASELASSAVDFASLRFSNVYGPRQDWRGEGGVVAVFCAALVAGRVPTIFGSGKQTRDFVFVGDVVAAIGAALVSDSRLRDDPDGGPAYNISTGQQTSVEALAKVLRSFSGFAEPYNYGPTREGDIEHSALDPRKARSDFGWDARVSLENGLEQTYRWFLGSE